jgi:hypothetical protein
MDTKKLMPPIEISEKIEKPSNKMLSMEDKLAFKQAEKI